MDMMDYFKTVLLIMFFYSVSITLITHYLPTAAQHQVTSFTNVGAGVDLNSTATQVQGSLDSQLNLPLVEMGALVFYSGNILLDLLLNFVFAIPEMIGLLITGLCNLINIPAFIGTTVQIFSSVIMVVMYIIGLIQLVTNVRSGRIV
jgi:hypothetical protein